MLCLDAGFSGLFLLDGVSSDCCPVLMVNLGLMVGAYSGFWIVELMGQE